MLHLDENAVILMTLVSLVLISLQHSKNYNNSKIIIEEEVFVGSTRHVIFQIFSKASVRTCLSRK